MINSSTDGLQLGDVVSEGGTFSRSLLFKSLSTDQAGIYTCYNSATHSSTIEYNLFVGSELCIPECGRANFPHNPAIMSHHCTTVLSTAPSKDCETGKAKCGYHAVCTDTVESYRCTCMDGFEGNGAVCNGMLM